MSGILFLAGNATKSPSGKLPSTSYYELIVLVFIFILIMVGAYFVTRWVGNACLNMQKNSNIRVLEMYRLNQTKYIYLVKIADKTVALGITKDKIEYLTEVNEADLKVVKTQDKMRSSSFLSLLINRKKNSQFDQFMDHEFRKQNEAVSKENAENKDSEFKNE